MPSDGRTQSEVSQAPAKMNTKVGTSPLRVLLLCALCQYHLRAVLPRCLRLLNGDFLAQRLRLMMRGYLQLLRNARLWQWRRRNDAKENEKALRQTQTLLAGCCKAEPKIFAPPQTPFPAAQDGQNLTSWRWSLPSSTDPVWWRSMHPISSYRDNRPTNRHKPTNKQTGPITIHCAAKLSAQCNDTPSTSEVVLGAE